MIIALTGGTGFVGKHLIALAVTQGYQLRALTRRPQPIQPGVTWIEGALDTPAALANLVNGSDVVLHVAGTVNAPDRAGFAKGNIDGTQAMIDAAVAARVPRFVHISSLAAREPDLSNYGWSKAESERRVSTSPLAWTIIRPPAIYGPGDMEMRDTFRMAKMGIALLPPPGKMSVIHVDDLARLLLALATNDAGRAIFEADDGKQGGWTHAEFLGQAIGAAVGKRVLPLALPKTVLMLAASLDGLLRGDDAKLTRDRVGYMCHPDWTIDPNLRPPETLWEPQIPTAKGLAETAAWYRASGLL